MNKKKLSSITEKTTSPLILAINGKVAEAPAINTSLGIAWYRIAFSMAAYHSVIVTMSKFATLDIGVCNISMSTSGSYVRVAVGQISSLTNNFFKSQIRYKPDGAIIYLWIRNPHSVLFLTRNTLESNIVKMDPPEDALTPS